MKKLLYILPILAVAISLFTPLTTYAVSDYDAVIKPSKSTMVTSYDWTASGGVCATNSPQINEVQMTWGSMILDADNYYGSAASYADDVITLFNAQLENGQGWSVSEYTANSPYTSVGGCDMNTGDHYVKVSISDDVNLEFTDLYSSHQLTAYGNGYDVFIHYRSDTAALAIVGVNAYTSASPQFIQQQAYTNGNENPLFINFNITYPEEYEGEHPPSSSGGGTPIKPEFEYRVLNKQVNARDYTQDLPVVTPDEGYTIQGYSVEWQLLKCTTYTEVGNICNDPDQVEYKILPQEQEFGFQVADYADYHLVADYLVQECYDYDGIPDEDATPDYCFYVDLGSELPEYDFTSSTVHLKIDGSASSGSTSTFECDVSGFCQAPQFNCEDMLDFGSKFNCNIQKDFNNDQYGLTQVIAAPISILTNLSNSSYGCSPILLPLPFVDSIIPLPCLNEFYEDHGGELYSVYQTIVSGIVAYYVLLGLLAMVKGFKDPQNDRIEALKL